MNILKRMKTRLIVVILIAVLAMISGCVAAHVQGTLGFGDKGTDAAAAMSAGEAWPAQQDGNMFGSGQKKIVRPARD